MEQAAELGRGERRRPLVLVVDDDPLQRLRAGDTLEEAGFEVVEAESGEHGLALAFRLRPDLIILDLLMPGLDGFAVCRGIRAHPPTANIPVLVATGLDDLESIEAAFTEGATDFVTKPINWPLLGYRVKFALRVKSMEDDLRDARDRAEGANRAKAAFLATMSHELRTPLNAIIGFADLLAAGIHGPLPAAYLEYVGHIARSGRHLLDILNVILEFAEVEGGVAGLAPEPCDPAAAVAAVFDELGEAARAADVRLSQEIAPSAGQVIADRRALQRILHHVLANGIKFNRPGGHVAVSVRRDGHGQSVIVVADDGIGIPPDRLEAVLEPFRQVEEGLARSHEGAGLGLAVANALVGMHGGRLSIASRHGHGTEVTVVLPRAPAAARP